MVSSPLIFSSPSHIRLNRNSNFLHWIALLEFQNMFTQRNEKKIYDKNCAHHKTVLNFSRSDDERPIRM